MRCFLFISATAILFGGCGQVEIDFFDLGEFRVMALVADTPEVDANTVNTVNITPWISDVDAGGRLVEVSILACLDPGIALGAAPLCNRLDALTQEITYTPFSTTALAGQNYTGAMPSFQVTVPSNLASALPSDVQYNGVDYLISMAFTAGGESIQTFKRIRVSVRPTPNQNPALQDILVDGSATQVPVEGSVVTYTLANPPETFDEIGQSGNNIGLEESYLATWFVLGGTLSLSRSGGEDKADFQTGEDPSIAPMIVAVLRDGRGGTDVLIR